MRDQWYGDNRDLVKWGVLLTLGERYHAKGILQVLYHRPSSWGQLEIDGDFIDLPAAVREHFRSVLSISRLQCAVNVDVVQDEFKDRDEYLNIILKKICARSQTPWIVFLDPDTGLEPRIAGYEHVKKSELFEIWKTLDTGDILALYQHQTNRNGMPWIQEKKSGFESALRIPLGTAKMGKARTSPLDVCIFFAEKRDSQRGE